jgi:uncharacterized membrane protein
MENKTTQTSTRTPAQARPQTVRAAGKIRSQARTVAYGALIAALYVVLTYLCSLLGLSSMAIQARFSEALCVLTLYTAAAVPGMWLGCLLANLLTGAVVWDVIFGSLATLVGALGGWLLGRLAHRAEGKGNARRAMVWKILVPLPTVVANTVVVPLVLTYAYGLEDGLPYLALTVGLGEVLSAWIFGLVLLFALEKRKSSGKMSGKTTGKAASKSKGQ